MVCLPGIKTVHVDARSVQTLKKDQCNASCT
jgi:hypothetical protein